MARVPYKEWRRRMSDNINNTSIEQIQINDEVEIDLGQLWKLVKKNIRLIILSALVLAIAVLLFTMFFIEKKYSSETRIYLTPKVTEQGFVDNATVTTNNVLVNNYVSILKGENILSKVAEELGLPSVGEVKKGLSVTNESNTQIISVVSTTDDATKSKQIAETTAKIFFSEMKESLNITSMTILDEAKVNNGPVSPSLKKNALLGGIAGAALACGWVFLKFLLDKRLRNRNEAENFLGLPVLAEIPFYES